MLEKKVRGLRPLFAAFFVGCGGLSAGVATTPEPEPDARAPLPTEDSSPGDSSLPDAGSQDSAREALQDVADVGPGEVSTLDAGDASQDAGASDAPPEADAPPVCVRPADMVFYTQDSWNELADALLGDPSPCADHFISIPALANAKTQPRGPLEPQRMRARGPAFHAMAEFHWGGWSQVTDLTWYEKGVEFRRRMALSGYDVAAGDTWAINELPSTIRTSPVTRQNARDAVRGLHEGPPGSPLVAGTVFVIGIGQGTTFLGTYKTNLKAWLGDAPFWADMDGRVRFWGQETYGAPDRVCVPLATLAEWSSRIEDYVEHAPTLANAAPAAAAPRTFLERAHVPLMNAAMRASAYNTTGIALSDMQHFVSMQVYAARQWSGAHPASRATVGFAWTWERTLVTPSEISQLAARLASALHHAYDLGGGAPLGACDPAGLDTWCHCEIPGSSFNDAWRTFATW